MCRTAKKLFLLAPIWYPTIGFLVCLITLSLATEMREIGGNAALTFRFGARGLFQLTIIAGAAVAFVGWFFQKRRKTLLALVLFGVFAVGAALLGWIFAQSIIHL
jgi:hypothetical protein